MHIPGEGLSKLRVRCSGFVAAAQSTWARETRLWVGWGAAREWGQRGGLLCQVAMRRDWNSSLISSEHEIQKPRSKELMLQSVSSQIKPHSPMTGQKEMWLFLCSKLPFSTVFRVSVGNIPQKKGTAPQRCRASNQGASRGLMGYTEYPQTSAWWSNAKQFSFA